MEGGWLVGGIRLATKGGWTVFKVSRTPLCHHRLFVSGFATRLSPFVWTRTYIYPFIPWHLFTLTETRLLFGLYLYLSTCGSGWGTRELWRTLHLNKTITMDKHVDFMFAVSSPLQSCQGSHSDWKTWKNGKAFSSQEKSGNFEQTGQVRENHTQYWKTQGIWNK